MGLLVRETDLTDDAALAAWHALEEESVRVSDPGAAHRTLEALRSAVRHPSAYVGRVLLEAGDDGGSLVGVAELTWPLQEDHHLCSADVHVRPDARRHGAGRALWQEVDRRRRSLGRTTVEAELELPADDSAAPGPAFAEALGFRLVHLEDHLVLGLPVDPGHRERLLEHATATSGGYEVVTWRGRCPDDLVEAYCALRTRMEHDVPTGDLAGTPVTWDEARLRSSEERTSRAYTVLVAAARRAADGEMAAYTLLFAPHDDDTAVQDDTLVMPEHRGRRLGTLVKLANLEALAELAEPRRVVHTWTDPDNAAMVAVNRAFGFVTVSRCHQVQWREDTAG